MVNHARGLHTIEAQKKLHIEREIMEFEQVIDFEVEGNGALQEIGLDGHNLGIVEASPQGDLGCGGRQIRPIEDRGLFIGHASPFWAKLRAEYSPHAVKSKRIV
jgi:hypothetical protein